MEKKGLLVLISLLISAAVFISVFFITFKIATAVSPPYFIDENGEKRAVMAMGQAFLGIIFGVTASIFSLVVCYRKFSKKD